MSGDDHYHRIMGTRSQTTIIYVIDEDDPAGYTTEVQTKYLGITAAGDFEFSSREEFINATVEMTTGIKVLES